MYQPLCNILIIKTLSNGKYSGRKPPPTLEEMSWKIERRKGKCGLFNIKISKMLPISSHFSQYSRFFWIMAPKTSQKVGQEFGNFGVQENLPEYLSLTFSYLLNLCKIEKIDTLIDSKNINGLCYFVFALCRTS